MPAIVFPIPLPLPLYLFAGIVAIRALEALLILVRLLVLQEGVTLMEGGGAEATLNSDRPVAVQVAQMDICVGARDRVGAPSDRPGLGRLSGCRRGTPGSSPKSQPIARGAGRAQTSPGTLPVHAMLVECVCMCERE